MQPVCIISFPIQTDDSGSEDATTDVYEPKKVRYLQKYKKEWENEPKFKGEN